jgi:hypothetical protein
MCRRAHQLEFGDSSDEPEAHKIVVAMLTWTNLTTHKQTQTLLKASSSRRGDFVGRSLDRKFGNLSSCWQIFREMVKNLFFGPTLLVTKTSRLFNLCYGA